MRRVHGSFANAPFKIRRGEAFRRIPVITYKIGADGIVSNVKLVRTSGIKDVDEKEAQAISQWRYQPRPVGCGVIETKVSITIDFR